MGRWCLLYAALACAPAEADLSAEVTRPWSAFALVGPRMDTDAATLFPNASIGGEWRFWAADRWEARAILPVSVWVHQSNFDQGGLPTSVTLWGLEAAPGARLVSQLSLQWSVYGDLGVGVRAGWSTLAQRFVGGATATQAYFLARGAFGFIRTLGPRWSLMVQPLEVNEEPGPGGNAFFFAFQVGARWQS